MVVLGIESSCDETAAAICKDGAILSNVVKSQEIHNKFGGVVPEFASREHDMQINKIVQKAISMASIGLDEIDSIAVTYGPGLLGSLLVGLNYAKGLAIGLKIPFIGVNHLEGHLYSSFIDQERIKFPFLCLLVTGGHTQIWEVKDMGKYFLHSTTVDDAAGEAFDKGARILGLGYPGGPEIEKAAKNGNPDSFIFSMPKVKNNPLNFSFSGIKTAILYKMQDMKNEEKLIDIADIAASYQEIIIDTLLDRLKKVIYKTDILDISITGGVAANGRFRSKVKKMKEKMKIQFYFPNIEYCTDNAAMIAKAGYQRLKTGYVSSLDLEANPNLRFDDV